MSWIFVLIAGVFEVCCTFCMAKAKQSTGPEMNYWYGLFAVCLVVSMFMLDRALKTIPIGTAYAVWTGIGAVGTVIVGIIFFKEPSGYMRILFIVTLISSIVGLKFVSH